MKKQCCCNKNDESCEGIFVEQGCCYVPNPNPRESWVNIDRDYSGAPFQSSPIGGTPDGLIRTQLTSCGGGADWSGNWYDETIDGGGQFNDGSINGLGIAFGDQSKDADGKKCQTICVSACTILDEFRIGINDTDASLPECVEVEVGSYDVVNFGTSQADWTLTILANGNEFWCPNIENTWIQFVIQDKQNFCFKWIQHDSNQAGSGSTSFFQAVYHDKVTKYRHTCTEEVYYEFEDGTRITELPENSVCQDLTCHGLPSAEPCIDRLIYRYQPVEEEGFNVRWWDDTHGSHLDPLQWIGPADFNGFPLPTANPPDTVGINNSANINDSNSGQANARYGIIDGWILLPEGTTNIRDNNANTGEFGMVLTANCCQGILTEQAGGNHTTQTAGADRTMMDSVPVTSGWLQIYNPSSDIGAAQGLDLEYSTDGGNTWINVPLKQPTAPVVECMSIPSCDPIPEGWQEKPLYECCEAIYLPKSELDETAIVALFPPQEICGGDFVDVTGRTGWIHTWTPTYTANSGTIIEDWIQISTIETSPDCETDMTVNVSLGNSYFQLRNMYGRAWYDVRLLVNGTPVTTWTFQNYHYEDDLSEANLSDDVTPLGSVHFARPSVPAGSTISVEVLRRHSFIAGNAAIAEPFGRVISGLRAHFNAHYSPTQIITGRV